MAALLECRTAVVLIFIDCPVALQSYIANVDIWQSTSACSTVALVKGATALHQLLLPAHSGAVKQDCRVATV